MWFMETKPKPLRVNFTVAPGSALERFLLSEPRRKVAASLHELAAVMEGMKAK